MLQIEVHISFHIRLFAYFFSYILRNGIVGSHMVILFFRFDGTSFLLHSGCMVSRHNSIGVFPFLTSLLDIYYLWTLMTFLWGVRQYFIMVLICIPLIISDNGCDFMLLALCTSSLPSIIKVFCLIFWLDCMFLCFEFCRLFVYFEYQLVCCIIYKMFADSHSHPCFQKGFLFACLFYWWFPFLCKKFE